MCGGVVSHAHGKSRMSVPTVRAKAGRYDGLQRGHFPAVGEILPPFPLIIRVMDSALPQDFATTTQAAIRLQVSQPTVADYLRRGWLSGQKIGRSWRIETASIERLLRCGPPARG